MTTRFQGQTQEEAAALVFKSAARASMAVLIIPGDVADDLGGQGLQLVANQAGRNVITDRASRFHSERLFRPEAAAQLRPEGVAQSWTCKLKGHHHGPCTNRCKPRAAVTA